MKSRLLMLLLLMGLSAIQLTPHALAQSEGSGASGSQQSGGASSGTGGDGTQEAEEEPDCE